MDINFCKTLENAPLAEYSSMKTGGNARLLCLPQSMGELKALVEYFNEKSEKFLLFGNLSNVLVPDEGFCVPVILTGGVNETRIIEENGEKMSLFASCGASVTGLAYDMCKKGYSGLEFAYGIPGSIGGAVYMNAGAYGGEFSDVAESVTALDKNAREIEISADDCGFGYRKSVFSQNGYCITGAVLTLKKTENKTPLETAREYMSRRKEKQPIEYPSCGSAFKRPKGYFAGQLIEQAGLRGFCVGGACVSEKHAGFVINKSGAESSDVIELLREVRRRVFENSGVLLEPEIRLLKPDGEIFEL